MIERLQGGQGSLNTHHCAYYRRAWAYAKSATDEVGGFVIDPFARMCPWADYRNDINPNIETTTHTMDAIDFLDEMLDVLGKHCVDGPAVFRAAGHAIRRRPSQHLHGPRLHRRAGKEGVCVAKTRRGHRKVRIQHQRTHVRHGIAQDNGGRFWRDTK
jgi:hypothetical protein